MMIRSGDYQRLSRQSEAVSTRAGSTGQGLGGAKTSLTETPVSQTQRRAWEGFNQTPLPGQPEHQDQTPLPNEMVLTTPGGAVSYLSNRVLPQADDDQILTVHTVVAGDRLDLLADRYYGDVDLYWLICDANQAMLPQMLMTPGTQLRIPIPKDT